MISVEVLPLLLLKHTVAGVVSAVGSYACRKSVKQMLHRRHMVTANLAIPKNKRHITFYYVGFKQVLKKGF